MGEGMLVAPPREAMLLSEALDTALGMGTISVMTLGSSSSSRTSRRLRRPTAAGPALRSLWPERPPRGLTSRTSTPCSVSVSPASWLMPRPESSFIELSLEEPISSSNVAICQQRAG